MDTDTGIVRVPRYIVAVDCGTALHPKLAEGQAEGAALNGISYALTEQYIFDEKGIDIELVDVVDRVDAHAFDVENGCSRHPPGEATAGKAHHRPAKRKGQANSPGRLSGLAAADCLRSDLGLSGPAIGDRTR